MIGSPHAIGVRLAKLATATAAVLLLCLGGSASAAQLHEYSGTAFGPDGVGGSESFESVQGIAVDTGTEADPGTGDIYVLDTLARRLYKFDSAGAPADFSALGKNYIENVGPGYATVGQLAVAPPGSPGGTAGDIYVADSERSLGIYGSDGDKLGEIEKSVSQSQAVCGVAVSESGALFVGESPGSVTEYQPTANPPVAADQTSQTLHGYYEIPGGWFEREGFHEGVCNVAVNNAGNIFAANPTGKHLNERGSEKFYTGGVEKLESMAALKSTTADAEGMTLAIEPVTEHLFADRLNQVIEYNASGKRLGSFGEGVIEGSRALATTLTGSKVYVGTATSVKIFGPKIELPEAEFEAPTEVTDTGAVLNGWIDPAGPLGATCQFEYVSESSYRENEASEPFAGAKVAPCEPAGPFAGAGENQVSAKIEGLTPRRAYFFRIQATNANGSNYSESEPFASRPVARPPIHTFAPCGNESLRSDAGSWLPDCRAYELVSPVDKWGSAVEPYESFLQATVDGSAVTWFTGESASGISSAGEAAHQDPAFYLSSRSGEAWSTQRLLPPEADGERGHFAGLTADGHYAVLEASNRGGGSPALYLLDTSDQEVTPIVPPRTGLGKGNRAFAFDGAGADDTLFFFESALPLTSKAAPGETNLYVWNRETKELSVAGVLPGTKGEVPTGGSFGGAYSWSSLIPGGIELKAGGASDGLYVGALHAILEHGDGVYFTAGGSGQLYLRTGFTAAKQVTVRVSSANSGVTDPNGQQPAAFQEATPSGEFAFFSSSGKLTANANTGHADEGADLYRYNSTTKTLVDVTPLAGGAGARVEGLLGVAENGRSGYLAAEGILADGGTEGKNNLYHFEEEAPGVFGYRFVVTLPKGGTEERNWSPSVEMAKVSRVSADGRTLLFMSSADLTGEPQGRCSYGVCGQVYRYSVGEDSPTCLSCNPYTAVGTPIIGAELSTVAAPNLVPENYPTAGVLQRNLSADGTRVFFQTSEALLPEDVNGQGCTSPFHCVDVYEWEAVGAPDGSCQVAEFRGGCLYLISSGKGEDGSSFIDASADGSNVFFTSLSPLVPVDQDHLDDIYDARIDGGIAAQHASVPKACSSVEACKRASVAAPRSTTPTTTSYQGEENVKPKKAKACKKGFVRKHGKCVKKPKQQKKKHKSKKQGKKRKADRTAGTEAKGGAK